MTPSTHQNPGCLGALLRLFRGGTDQEPASLPLEPLPYRLRDDFLSPAELSFYHVLSSVVAPQVTVLTKVRLADLFFVARPHENRSYANRIAQKHVDFVLCDPRTMQPIMGIELDDTSHARADRVERDAFVDQVFAAAHLTLVHLSVQRAYSPDEIAAQVFPVLHRGTPPSALGESVTPTGMAEPTTVPPICPKCGIPMVVRTATRGDNRGKQFYGCANYPQCREVAPV